MKMAKGIITIDENFCKGCELCISVCPKKILMLNPEKINSNGYNPAIIMDIDSCIACGNCARICPEIAIKVEKID